MVLKFVEQELIRNTEIYLKIIVYFLISFHSNLLIKIKKLKH